MIFYERYVLSKIERNFAFGDLNFFLNESLAFREKKSSCDFFDMTALSALILALKLANFAILAKKCIFQVFACIVKAAF